jgi:hypothetical protein
MKAKIKSSLIILMILAAILASFLSITSVNAASTKTYTSVQEVADEFGPGGSAGNTSWPNGLASYFTTEDHSSYDSWSSVSVGGQTYYYVTNQASTILAQASQTAAASNAVASDSQAVSQYEDITSGMNIRADTEQGRKVLTPLVGVINIILGVIVIGIGVMTTVVTGLDIAYIVFPTFRTGVDTSKSAGGGMIGAHSQDKNGDGEGKLRLVSDEAVFAVKSADTIESGKNPLAIYFKKRALGYILLAIVLFVFLTGRITIFTTAALKLVDGILKLIQGASLH